MSGPISAIIVIGTMASMMKTTKAIMQDPKQSKVSLTSTVKLLDEQLQQFRQQDEQLYNQLIERGMSLRRDNVTQSSIITPFVSELEKVETPEQSQKLQQELHNSFHKVLDAEQNAIKEKFILRQNINNVRNKYKEQRRDLNNLLKSINTRAKDLDEFAKQSDLTSEALTRVQNLNASLDELPQNLDYTSDLDTMNKKYEEISELWRKANAESRTITKEFQDLRSTYQSAQTENILAKSATYAHAKLHLKRLEEQELQIHKLLEEQEVQKQFSEEHRQSLQIIDECKLFSHSEDLKIEIDNALNQLDLYTDYESIRNFRQISLNVLLKKCHEENEMYLTAREQYFLLWPQYQVICQSLGVEQKTFDKTPEGISELADAIHNLESKFLDRIRCESVGGVIDEVMEQMGYNVIGKKSSVNRRGELIDQKLMEFSDTAAIHIIETEKGQITMEIVGTDNKDRLATQSEKKQLKNEMVSFCQKFPEIRNALAQKGIQLNNISELPADEQFAKIVGFDSYDTSMQTRSQTRNNNENKSRYLNNEE